MRFQPLGDSAVLIRIGSGIDDATLARVHRVVAAIEAAPPPGLVDIVPAYDSIAIFHDCSGRAGRHGTAFDALCAALSGCIAVADDDARVDDGSHVVEVPVHYGGADGPDLDFVARHCGLTPARVVDLHAGAEYRVAMIGFAPGFPYLSGLPPRLETPRRTTPRTRVPAGSVGIAGLQTGVYPLATPGGWQLIGRTDTQLFDAATDPPTLLRVGDRVRFRPVA